jgi:hypothetical protein
MRKKDDIDRFSRALSFLTEDPDAFGGVQISVNLQYVKNVKFLFNFFSLEYRYLITV